MQRCPANQTACGLGAAAASLRDFAEIDDSSYINYHFSDRPAETVPIMRVFRLFSAFTMGKPAGPRHFLDGCGGIAAKPGSRHGLSNRSVSTPPTTDL
jgi:hypothetical protein